MKSKKKSIVLLVLLIFVSVINKFDVFNQNLTDETESLIDKDSTNKLIKEKDIDLDDLNSAGNYDQHNFTFKTIGSDQWNKTWKYENGYNLTSIDQPGTIGLNVSYQFNITELRDNNTRALISVGDITNFWLFYHNGITFIPLGLVQDGGIGKGHYSGYIHLPTNIDGLFFVMGWNREFTYNATMTFRANKTGIVEADFRATKENTESNQICWELTWDGYPVGNYSGTLELDSDIDVLTAQGRIGQNWELFAYSRNSTHIIIDHSYEEYKVNIETPNYVSIVYNENLTIPENPWLEPDDNSLNLYVYCKIAGNLTIRLKLPNSTILEVNKTVIQNEIVFFNHTMNHTDMGGIADLNVTLINTSTNQFGVKITDVSFHKNAVIWSYTENTTAFRNFIVIAGYVDIDKYNWYVLNNGTTFSLTTDEMMNRSLILNASVRFALEDEVDGDLEFSPFDPDFGLYIKVIDLDQLLILPGDYNMTFTAYKPGYTNQKFINPFVISKREVFFDIQSLSDTLVIEGDLSFGISLYVADPGESFLRHPVSLNLTFTHNESGKIDYNPPIPDIVQSLAIIDVVSNDTHPGTYILNMTVISDYYVGSHNVSINITKKEIGFDVDFGDLEIEVGDDLELNWSVSENYNYVNMSYEVYFDNELWHKYNVTEVKSGIIIDTITNDTLPGIYLLNLSIISPFYEGNYSYVIEIVKKPLDFQMIFDDLDIEEGDDLEIDWSIEDIYNFENMTLEIYIDGVLEHIFNVTSVKSGTYTYDLDEGDYTITYKLVSPYYSYEKSFDVEVSKKPEKDDNEVEPAEDYLLFLIIAIIAIIAVSILAIIMFKSRGKIQAQRELDSELLALKNKTAAMEKEMYNKAVKIAQIASIYWIMVVHNEAGVTLVEIIDFKYEEVLQGEETQIIGKGTIRDSALISGFLTAIRNFSQETTGTGTHQPIFNSQTDYSTVIDGQEVHRHILEGNNYFMAIVSGRESTEITDILSEVNKMFDTGYTEKLKSFNGNINDYVPYKEEVITYLHKQINDIRAGIEQDENVLNKYRKELTKVQDKIGIKPKKSEGTDYK